MLRSPCVGLALALLVGGRAAAQPYRENLMLPVSQLYERMLAYGEDKDFQRVERSLPAVKPVLDALKSRYGVDLEAELRDGVARKEAEALRRSLKRLVILDMKDLMLLAHEGAAQSKDRAATHFRNAYLDYLLVSAAVQNRNFTADQRIRNAFRRGVLQGSPEGLRGAAEEIERELSGALPEAAGLAKR